MIVPPPFIPWIAGGAAALLLVTGAGGFHLGYKVADGAAAKREAKAVEAARKAYDAQAEKLQAKSSELERLKRESEGRDEIRTNTIREIYRTMPAPAALCAAPDRVAGVLDDAVADANAAALGQPFRSVPRTGAASAPADRP